MTAEHLKDYEEDGEDRLRRIIRSEMNTRRLDMGLSYTEFPTGIVKWLAGGLMSLACIGIVSLVVMYGQMQRMQEEVAALRADFNDFKRLVEPRYRGSDDASAPR